MKNTITIDSDNKVTVTKASDTKYMMNYNNFDKKFIFGKEFINKTTFRCTNKKAVIEIVAHDKSKEIFIIDFTTKTVTQTTIEELKKMKNKMQEQMLFEYFSDVTAAY